MTPPTVPAAAPREGELLALDDPADFLQLVRRHDAALRALVYRLVGDRDAMDDVLQETYLKAYRARASFRGESALGTWLHRIAYNAAMDELRRRSRVDTAPLDDSPEPASPGTDPADLAALRGDLAAALAALPAEQRAAVLLVDGEGLDYAAAGRVLGVPAGTVGSRASRARAALRTALTPGDLR